MFFADIIIVFVPGHMVRNDYPLISVVLLCHYYLHIERCMLCLVHNSQWDLESSIYRFFMKYGKTWGCGLYSAEYGIPLLKNFQFREGLPDLV